MLMLTLHPDVALHQYHLQIVPTSFKPLSADEPLDMHQYSVYERSIEVSLSCTPYCILLL